MRKSARTAGAQLQRRKLTRVLLLVTGVVLGLSLARWIGRYDATATPVAQPEIRARLQRTLAGHTKQVWQAAFSFDGRFLASAGVDGTARLWPMPDGFPPRTLTQPEGLTCLALSSDGTRIATGSYDGTVRLWRLSDDSVEHVLSGHQGTVWSVAFSPDGATLASSGEDKTVRLWRVDDGAALQALAGHALNVWSVEFSDDGQWLASGSFDKTAKLWRATNGELVRTFSGHDEAVVDLAFSPDSQILATASDDSSLKLWRVSDGQLIRTLTGGSEHVYAVAFSPDGSWLASGSRERGALGTLWRQIAGNRFSLRGKNVRLWKVADGSLQQAFAAQPGDVHSVAFAPDGRSLAVSGDATTVSVWGLERQ